MSEPITKTALVPLAEGCEEIEAVTIIDVLRRAEVKVTVAGVGSLSVKGAHGIRFEAAALISKCLKKEFDLIALPGGMPGAENLRDNKELITLLRKQQQANKLYAAICASPAVVLQHHGLIANRRITCHPDFLDMLPQSQVVEMSTVSDHGCITSCGPGTAMEFALTLVKELCGEEVARAIAMPMIVR